jgi:hypothetical protein
MRLTLRTMLAYLDDILEPGDSEELGQKIEESKFASDLVQRIRNSTRRLRLAAPALGGKGMGLDSNTVAEYLDNTLPPEHVPNFENVCLESEVHLAEVASCHQVLTLVLGEPADVDYAIRDRVYAIGNQSPETISSTASHRVDEASVDLLDEAALAESSSAGISLPTSSIAPRAAESTELPIRSLLVTVVLAFLLAIVGLRAMGEFNQTHPVLRLFGGGTGGDVAQSSTGTVVVVDAGVNTEQRGEPAGSTDEGATTNSTTEAPSTPSDTAATGDDASPSPDSIESPVVPGGTDAAETPPPSAGAGDGVTDGVAASPMPTVTDMNVGRYISQEQVLGRFDAETDSWLRLVPDTPLSTDDRLVVFPSYRPQILLTSGVKLTLVGAGELTVQDANGGGGGKIAFARGRALLVPVTETIHHLTVDFGSRQASILLPDLMASAAIDVRRYRPSEGEDTTPQVVVRLFATSGSIEWQEGDSAAQSLTSGQALTVVGTAAPTVHNVSAPPDWIEARDLKPIDRRAAQELREYLTPDRPLSLTLFEQTEFDRQHRVEVRALACRCLALMGIFDPALTGFADQRMRAYWGDLFMSLKAAQLQNSESAAQFEALVSSMHGGIGPMITRMLRGISPAQLADGGADELVSYLEHPVMNVRVLAYLELERITGITYLFLPWQPPGRERDKLAKWRGSLKDGRVRYRDPPSPLPEFTAAE